MTTGLQQIDANITGAWAIFLRKNNALKYFEVNIQNFIYSFATISLILVFQLYMAPIESQIFSEAANGKILIEKASFLQVFILITNWFLWPLVAYIICKLMNITEHFLRYVIVDNWSAVVTLTLVAAPVILFHFGLPSSVTLSLMFFSSVFMLIYKWRVAKVSLATTGGNAAILLFIDVAFTMVFAFTMKSVFS